MKKVIFLFVLILSGTYSISAQDLIKATQLGVNTNTEQKTNQIAKQVAAKRFGDDNASALLQIPDKKRVEHSEYVSNEIYFDLNKNELRKIFEDKNDYLVLDIPVADSKSFQVELIRTNIFSNDFRVVTSDGDVFYKEDIPGVFYRGIVKDNENSIVSFSIFENHIEGLIADDYGNYILGQMKDADTYVLYNDKALKVNSNLSCDVTEEMEANANTQVDNITLNSTASGCIDIYIEADYTTYQDFGNSTTNVTNFITSLFNQVSTLYANENISIQLSETFVWTSSDPYLADGSTSTILHSFRDNRPTFNGDLAHFITTRQVLGGGVAWVNQLCGGLPYAVSSSIRTNVVPLPTYSWNVFVFAHEMGHNFGSLHTHQCVWNGNNTQIDDCGSVGGQVQSCYDSANPIIPANGGTIMSYCHLNTVGINLNLGFGQQPGDIMRDRYNNASCAGPCTDDNSADLIISSKSLSTSSVNCGSSLSASATVKNNGNATTNSSSYLRYYLSTNTTWSSDDTYLGQDYVGSLAAGSSSNESATVTIPSSLSSGTYYILFVADYANVVNETNENNNVAYQSISVSCGGNTCTNTVSAFPYSEGFENGLGAWTQDTGDDINWTRDANGTTSNNTGPSSAAQGTYYMYTEASGNYNKVANLISPCFDLSSVSDPTLTFQYHMYGANMGNLLVEVSTNNGNSWSSLWLKPGNAGISWKTASISLNNYTSETALKIRFKGTIGNGYTSDIAIDDITLFGSSGLVVDDTDVNPPTGIRNYPNPFTGQTTIEFTLVEDLPVTLFVSDLTGRQVAVLLDHEQKFKGIHQVVFDGNNYPAGMYYYTMQAGSYVATQKMTLVK